jgi:hypothetical protein
MFLTLGPLFATDTLCAKVNNPNFELVFDPQQAVGEAYASIPGSVRQYPLSIRLVEGRALDNLAVVGSRTDDDDRLFDLKATNEVVPFVEKILVRNAQEWGIRVAGDADLVLTAELLTFKVTERDKAVGATFKAEVRLAAQLQNRAGTQLWAGSAFGDATRYGKKLSNQNCNEVLSDAMLESFADLFSNSGLHRAWTGEPEPTTTVQSSPTRQGAVSPADLLDDLRSLLAQGFSKETLIDFVNQRSLTAPLSAEDLTQWKAAGVPEEVIRAAMKRPVR